MKTSAFAVSPGSVEKTQVPSHCAKVGRCIQDDAFYDYGNSLAISSEDMTFLLQRPRAPKPFSEFFLASQHPVGLLYDGCEYNAENTGRVTM